MAAVKLGRALAMHRLLTLKQHYVSILPLNNSFKIILMAKTDQPLARFCTMRLWLMGRISVCNALHHTHTPTTITDLVKPDHIL